MISSSMPWNLIIFTFKLFKKNKTFAMVKVQVINQGYTSPSNIKYLASLSYHILSAWHVSTDDVILFLFVFISF